MVKPKKQKDGRYRVQIKRPNIGLRKDRVFSTKREADHYIAQINLKYADSHAEPTIIKKRFSDLVEEVTNKSVLYGLKRIDKKPYSKSTIDNWANQWKLLSDAGNFKTIPVNDLTWKFMNNRLWELFDERDWQFSTHYKYTIGLGVLFEYAKSKSYVARNPLNDVEKGDRFNKGNQRHRVVTESEFKRLLLCAEQLAANAQNTQESLLHVFIRFMWETGCRRGELLKLEYQNIIFLEDDDFGAQIIFKGETTKNSEEKVSFISKDLANLINDIKKKTNNHKLFLFKAPYKEWATVKRMANLDGKDARYDEPITFHHLRHSWATRLGSAGANLKELKDAAGWKSSSQADRYVHSTEESVRSALLKRIKD